MCGIAGILDRRNRWELEQKIAVVETLCDLQRHRGPDANGTWISTDRTCVLGHRRLAIIDLDTRSNQPMLASDDTHAIVFNGEIYNYRELREEMLVEGCRFRTLSDTEVLLEGFKLWGTDVFARLDGMFALAIYDTTSGDIVLARDRIGEKPLYVARANGIVAFASEFKPLLAVPGVSSDISVDSLYEYFALRYVPDPNTLYEAISSVQPGTFQVLTADGAWRERGYFAFDIPVQRAQHTQEEYIDRLDQALTSAIRTRLVADVPVGALLSSGVDSSLVCSIAADALGRDIRCFSAGFVGGMENETGPARAIAEYLGVPFQEYLVSEQDLLDTVARFGEIMDEPNADRSCVPTYFLSRLVRSAVTVAVSGDGGDELFGGYGRYAALREALATEPSPLDAVCAYLGKGLPVFDLHALERAFPGQAARFRQRFTSRFVSAFARKDLDTIERLRLIDLHSYLPGAVLAKVDRMSMRHSLEVRTPFFSPDILRLSMQLPMHLCADRHLLKLALRHVLARYLPQHLIRAGKQGFGMPASFFERHASVFETLAIDADRILVDWPIFRDRGEAFATLRQAARDNINSYWAWIVLGQWVRSVGVAAVTRQIPSDTAMASSTFALAARD